MVVLGDAAVAAALDEVAALAPSGPAMVAPRNRIMLAVAAAGFVAIMAGPTAYSLSTVGQAYSGGDPAAGPTSARVTAFGDSGFGGFGSGRFTPPDNAPAFSGDGAPSGARGAGGGGGLNQVNNALITYLDSHQGKATWLVAVDGANQAAASSASGTLYDLAGAAG